MAEHKEEKVSPKSLGVDEVQKKMDEETDQGFRGTKVDPTDNHAYTVGGVIKDEPTPETSPEQAAKVGSNKFSHVGEEKGKKKS
jgi:hypothetical protein